MLLSMPKAEAEAGGRHDVVVPMLFPLPMTIPGAFAPTMSMGGVPYAQQQHQQQLPQPQVPVFPQPQLYVMVPMQPQFQQLPVPLQVWPAAPQGLPQPAALAGCGPPPQSSPLANSCDGGECGVGFGRGSAPEAAAAQRHELRISRPPADGASARRWRRQFKAPEGHSLERLSTQEPEEEEEGAEEEQGVVEGSTSKAASGKSNDSTTSGGDGAASLRRMAFSWADGEGSPRARNEEELSDLLGHASQLIECWTAGVLNKNVELISRCIEANAQPDEHLSWPDLAIDVRGRPNVIKYYGGLVRSIPDLSMTLHKIEEKTSSAVQVTYTLAGTQQKPFLPFFPLGKFAKWQIHSFMTFDAFGKVREHRMHFTVIENPRLEPAVIEGLAQSALVLACTAGGSRLLQRVIEMARPADHWAILQQLRGHIWEVSASPHANYVLQDFIVAMPSEKAAFIITELAGHALAAAQHRIRCRVLERLLEHCPSEMTAGLVEELMRSVVPLCRHSYGNFIIQHVLEHGIAQHRHRIALAILGDVRRLARHRVSSNVVRCALVHCSTEDRQRLVQGLVRDTQDMVNLASHCVGSFVWREIKQLMREGVSAPSNSGSGLPALADGKP